MEAFIAVLRKIVQDEGYDVFGSPERFWAIAEDCLGGEATKERDMLLRFALSGVFPRLAEVYFAESSAARLARLGEVKDEIRQTGALSVEEAERLLEAFSLALEGCAILSPEGQAEDRRAKEEVEWQAREKVKRYFAQWEAERRTRAEADRRAIEWEAENSARKEAERQAREEAQRCARAEADRQARIARIRRQRRNRILAVAAMLFLILVVKGIFFRPATDEARVNGIVSYETAESTPVTEASNETIEEEQPEQQPEPLEEETSLPELPDLRGYSFEYARKELEKLDVDIGHSYKFSNEYNRGSVIEVKWDFGMLFAKLSMGLEYSFYDMYKLNSSGDEEYRDIYYVDNSGHHTEAYKIDGNSNLIYSFTFEYDEYDREVAQYFYDHEGNYHHRWKFEYNDLGQIIAEHKYDGTDRETDRYEYEYNDDHLMTTRREYKDGKLTYRWKMVEYDVSVSNAAYSPHLFGCWTRADIYDAEGDRVRIGTQTFDSEGSVKAFTVSDLNGRRMYEYIFDNAVYDEINNYSDSIRYEKTHD